jgi:predicted HNH restriction endonuclease
MKISEIKTHLVVSNTEVGKHKTLRENFIPYAHKGRVDSWTATKKFSLGDLALFYFGEPIKSIISIGFVNSEPETSTGVFYWTSKNKATFCDFKPVKLLENPISLESAAKSAELNHWYKSRPYRSSRKLKPEIAQALIDVIVSTNPIVFEFLQKNQIKLHKSKRLSQPQFQVQEGGVKEITIELQRRDPKLRTQAIAEYGYKCQVCKFDFEEFYGDLGVGYIEVHHLRPLSDRKRAHTVTIKNVAVVCANCHRVLHRTGKNPMKLEELRRIVEQRKRNEQK